MPQFDYERPLLRAGIVAGTYPALRTIILDCPSFPGNSGGLVLEIEPMTAIAQKLSTIGVISEFIPTIGHGNVANSGYAVAVSMDPVWDLIASFV